MLRPDTAGRRAGDDPAERGDLRAAQSYARVEPVGPLVLKGKADPITAYRLLDVSKRAPPSDRLPQPAGQPLSTGRATWRS